MTRQMFDILCEIIFGSLGNNFGIKVAVIPILWAIKDCAFWSHNCQLSHQVDIFRKNFSFFEITIIHPSIDDSI